VSVTLLEQPEKRDTFFISIMYENGQAFEYRIHPGDFEEVKKALLDIEDSLFIELHLVDNSWVWLTTKNLRFVRFRKGKELKNEKK